MSENKTNQLPTEPGFYWWRKSDSDSWRMVKVEDFGDGMLSTYDVDRNSWHGRSLAAWEGNFDPGVWVKAETPKAVELCGPDCSHSQEEHDAFDEGFYAGETEVVRLRAWIKEAAPIMEAAICIVINEAIHRFGELEGCRAVIELCPVEFESKVDLSRKASDESLSNFVRNMLEMDAAKFHPGRRFEGPGLTGEEEV